MNAKKAKALRKLTGYRADAEQKYLRFVFPGIHHTLRAPVFKRHRRVIRTMGPSGEIVTREEDRIIMRGRTPAFPEWTEERDTEGKLHVVPATTLLPVQKPVSLLASKQIEKHNYRRCKLAHRHGRNG